MDDLQLFRLLDSGGYYPRWEKSGNSDHLYDTSFKNCLLYTNLVGMKSSLVVEINQVRVGIIDLTTQTTAYLHEDEDSRILLVGTIRHQATMLRDEEKVHVVVLIVFADFDTSSYIARHTKEQVSLILGIHDGD
jgi:2',3'-cyclic-nucleotide 2'-phosphodiesterase (5'-nucleotidase family)